MPLYNAFGGPAALGEAAGNVIMARLARAARAQPTLTPPRALRARVRRFIVDHELIAPGERVLAGVSGGADSTCLLLVLAGLRRSLGFELEAAYFDHGLRGARAAARELGAVRALAAALEVPLHCGSGDARARAKGRSLEEAARELRYGYLAQAARERGCRVVAVGHTKDDQAETVLLHLIRGAGLRGLAAMPPCAPWPVAPRADVPRLIRPLLDLSRADTERACAAAGVAPLRDPTNRSRAFLRNRIRHELLPLLRRYNPRIDDALVRLAHAAAADAATLEQIAAQAIVFEAATPTAVRLPRSQLRALPEALQRHAVRLAYARLLDDTRGLAQRHVRAVLGAAAGPTGAQLDLPRGVRATIERDAVTLTTAGSGPAPLPDGEVRLPVPGSARFGGWRFEAQLLPAALGGPLPDDRYVVLLSADACGSGLTLRRRRPGDRFHPLGMAQAKKLQDFFVDAHVPRAERDAVPLVWGERGLVWVVGQRLAEWARVREHETPVVLLRATRMGEGEGR